jgi:hypothetical protein
MIGSVTSPATNSTGAFQLQNIGAATAATGFAVTPNQFPRLGAYAPIYQEYKFKTCDILFQANQPTTATGETLACVVYDAPGDSAETVPSTAIGMMRNISATMANVYSDCSLQLLGSLNRLPRYHNNSTTTSDEDIQATLFVATEGVVTALAQGLGYVIVEYEVEFFAPR